MDTKRLTMVIDVLTQQLSNEEQLLSDEAYEFLNSFENIDDIMVYYYALNEYLMMIKNRFLMEESDEEDKRIIIKMMLQICALVNAVYELEQSKPTIVIDEDE
jgi:hypothetical protein